MRRNLILFLGALGLFSSGVAQARGQWFDRVIVVVLENEDGSEVAAHPYFASLARRGGVFERYRTITHPSYPNYLALVGGSTFGVWTDAQVNLDQRHLGDLLEEAGLDWRNYAEDYPENCYLGEGRGSYVRRHVPFLSFVNVQQNNLRCRRQVREAAAFREDLRENRLPEFSLYVPNNRDNGHDTGLDFTARWLEGFLEPLLVPGGLPARTLVVVTFDESEGIFRRPIFTVAIGPGISPGTVVREAVDHYSLLRTIEENFRLPTLGRKDEQAKPFPLW